MKWFHRDLNHAPLAHQPHDLYAKPACVAAQAVILCPRLDVFADDVMTLVRFSASAQVVFCRVNHIPFSPSLSLSPQYQVRE